MRKRLQGSTFCVKTGCGKLFITLNVDEKEKPIELFCRMGKAGGCESSQSEALGRLISLVFRLGGTTTDITKQLIEIKCNKQLLNGKESVFSCADAIAQTLQEYEIKQNKKPKKAHKNEIYGE